MTYLEELWGDFPSSKPPVDSIVAAAKTPSTRTNRRLQIGIAAAVIAGFVAAPLLTGGGSGSSEPNTPIEYAAFQADIKPATSCDALLQQYKQRAMAQVGPYGWTNQYYGNYYGGWNNIRGYTTIDSAAAPMAKRALLTNASLGAHGFQAAGAMPNGAYAPGLLAQGNSATGTNVQEIGVDEPDTVKTNGKMVARINDNTLAIFDASGDAITPRGTLGLPYLGNGNILISGNTVVAAGNNTDPSATNGGTRVDTISISDPDHPSITSSVVYAGGSITALRQQGNTIRLVVNTGLPQVRFSYPQKGKRTNAQATAINKHMIAITTFKDWIPTYDAGTGRQQLLPCANVAIPPSGVPLGTTSIVSFDLSQPTTLHAIGVAGTLGNAYESQHNLYLTVGGGSGGCWMMMCPAFPNTPAGQDPSTTILQFALDGTRTTHVATGQVQGQIQNSWSMDEWAGILRVVTTRFGPQPPLQTIHNGRFTYQTWPPRSHVNVVETLVPHDKTLVRQGELTGLGQNQTLTAARWFNSMAIISTANQIDPLYTIDLSDPAHPKQLGALHLPGQTEYIHPISNNRFLTISAQQSHDAKGHVNGEYAQVALYDTTDPANPTQLSAVSVGQNTWSLAARDPKNFTWLPDRATALSAFSGPKGEVMGVFATGDNTMSQTLHQLTGSYSGARTFQVDSGKVVLIFGGSVTFLNL